MQPASAPLEHLLAMARATANRGVSHIFLGDPLSDGCDKTTVEAGNTYSPGAWTCGVSLGFLLNGVPQLVDQLPGASIQWAFIPAPGEAPVAQADYAIGTLGVRHRLTHLGGAGSEGVDFNEVDLSSGDTPLDAQCVIVVRDQGPAGAKIAALAWDAPSRTLRINTSLRLVCEQPPDEVLVLPADAQHDSPAAALLFRIARPRQQLSFRTEHGFGERRFVKAIPRCGAHGGLCCADGFARAADAWRAALPARVFAPDARVPLAWERCAAHILNAMECGLPRIGAINYPAFWMRDGVIILRALDLMGRHDLAHLGNEYLAPHVFNGGFGAESDAPGEGLWAMVSHARITCNWEQCREWFPQIRRRVAWLERMLGATDVIRGVADNRTATSYDQPASTIVCLPAQNGLIHGRMDFHSPDFFINCWAVAGLRMAAEAACACGEDALAAAWAARATAVDELLARHLLPAYGNERDPIVAPYPTGALATHREELARRLAQNYRAQRLTPDGRRNPETLWTYFEAAHAHNAFLIGLREEAWVTLNGMFAAVDSWDVAAFIEGPPAGDELLPFGNGASRRGWLDPAQARGGNMPHNWTSAEIITAIRDAFVTEEGGSLVLGVGVPRAWMRPGARFGVRDMPTDLGVVSYTITITADGRPELDYHGPHPYRLALPDTGALSIHSNA